MKKFLSVVLATILAFSISGAIPIYAAQSIENLKISNITSQAYTGKEITPAVTINDGDKKLEENIDYTLSYSNNKKIGTANVKVTGKGDYTGMATKNFNIVPAKMQISKVETTTNSQVKLTWKIQSNVDGYQIYYATKKDGDYKKLKTISNPQTVTYTTNGLSADKTYYFKIRAYAKLNDKTYGGKFSAISQVKTAKKPVDLSKATIGEKNALNSAKRYLDIMSFSYERLIKQLEFEKYSNKEATFAADNCGANWKEQALKSAKEYLETMPFSYKGLLKQLEYEKYTKEQATYGVDNCGANWNEQAVKSAKQYLELMSFSRDRLIDQLVYEGYTYEQAVYGVEKNGY